MNIDHVVRSRRKTVAIYVRPDGSLEVRAPLRLSNQRIQTFVDSKTKWITRQRDKLGSMQTPDTRNGYANGDPLWFLGKIQTLLFTADNNHQIKIEGGRLIAPCRLQNNFEHALTAWYRAEARRIITARVDMVANQNGLHYKTIRINSARSRWGSCSFKSNLNFPFRLVMAPLDIVDYVVVHELVHTVEHNHGKRFWEKVATILPDYLWRRKWLRLNGHLLDINLKPDEDKIVPVPTRIRRKPPEKLISSAH